jgi:hypothetical protein
MAIRTSQFSLTCYRVDCQGEFRYCSDESGDLLYECRECIDIRLVKDTPRLFKRE